MIGFCKVCSVDIRYKFSESVRVFRPGSTSWLETGAQIHPQAALESLRPPEEALASTRSVGSIHPDQAP